MNRHVDLEVADLVAGRLSDQRAREVEGHVKTCERCAGEVAWARRLYDDALREGLRHLAPIRIVALAAEGQTATDVEARHLEGCQACRDELDWARRQPEIDEAEEHEPVVVLPAAPRASRVWAWVGVAAALIAAALFLWVDRDGPDLAALATVAPLPVRITRDVPPPGSFEEARLQGLEAYAAGQWSGARSGLSAAVALRPEDAELLLYLGSADLIDGDVGAAGEHLGRAAQLATASRIHDEASWQLANLALLEHRRGDAVELLDRLAASGGHRAADAAALRKKLP